MRSQQLEQPHTRLAQSVMHEAPAPLRLNQTSEPQHAQVL